MVVFGKKLGTASIFKGDDRIAVTMVDVTDSVLASRNDKDDKVRVIVGYGKDKNASKAEQGIFKELGFVPHRKIAVETSQEELKDKKIGDTNYDLLPVGAKVKVIAVSKGKGFAGVMKRWGFKGLKRTHGIKDRHRSAGSIGTQGVDHVFKGKKMAGRMGTDQVTLKDVEVVALKEVENRQIALLQGTMPGPNKSVLKIRF